MLRCSARRLAQAAQGTAASKSQQVTLERTKASTGITGQAIHVNPLHRLRAVYSATLTALTDMPESAVYRQATAALTSNRLKAVEAIVADHNGDEMSEQAIEAVEAKLDQGVAETLVQIAEDELALAKKMVEWRA